MIGSIDQNTEKSGYQPTEDVKEFTARVQRDYQTGEDILNTPYLELNDRSILDDENRGQMMFNAFVDTEAEDPRDEWRWRGTRSMARNKGVAMHAQLTAGFLLPMFLAQNEDDEEDRVFSELMRYVVEWMTAPTNSNYQSSFLQVVFGMITNPITYLGAEYCEVMQKVKEKTANGKVITKEIVDEVLSGFQAPIWSSSQVRLTNAYERNIQKQRRIIKSRYVEKSELEAKYGDHPNWGYVKEGMKTVFNPLDQLFYDVKDEDHPTLVIEDTVMTRRDDSEVCFVGGIYLGAPDIEDNLMRHRDNRGAPKYDIVPFGYQRIGEHFAFYKSMMNTLGWDNMLYDAMSEIVMNRAILEVDAPVAVSGVDDLDQDVVFPSSVVILENPEAKISKLLPEANMNAGFAALRETEKSMSDSTLNDTMSGGLPDKEQKAYSVSQAQANAKKIIKGVGQSLAESTCAYGDLMKDIALNHIMSPVVIEDLAGESLSLKYRTLTLTGKAENGKQVSKVIKFDPSYLGLEVSAEEKDAMEMQHLEEIGYPDNKFSFIRANPEIAAKFKYLTRCDVEEIFVKNEEFWQPVLLNLKSALAKDPYTNQEELTKEVMYAFFKARGSKFVKKAPANQGLAEAGANPLGDKVMNRQLSTVASDAVQ
jgi:hypothetical protein